MTTEISPSARWTDPPFIKLPRISNFFINELSIGVVAHSIYGIDRVDFFLQNDKIDSVKEIKLNPRTNQYEYFTTINLSSSQNVNLFEFFARVYDNEGNVRELRGPHTQNGGHHSIMIDTEPHGLLLQRSPSDGSIAQMLLSDNLKDGDRILLTPGIYQLGKTNPSTNHQNPLEKFSIFISGSNVDNVIIEVGDGEIHNRILWDRVTFDFSENGKYSNFEPAFYNCKIINSDIESIDNVASYVQSQHWAINCETDNMSNGFNDANLVRNSVVGRSYKKALVDVQSVFGLEIRETDGGILESDFASVVEINTGQENLVYQDIISTDATYASSFAFNQDAAISNSVFINIEMENLEPQNGDPPFSEMSSQFNNVLIQNVYIPDQPLILHNILSADNLVFKNCIFWENSADIINSGSINGITAENVLGSGKSNPVREFQPVQSFVNGDFTDGLNGWLHSHWFATDNDFGDWLTYDGFIARPERNIGSEASISQMFEVQGKDLQIKYKHLQIYPRDSLRIEIQQINSQDEITETFESSPLDIDSGLTQTREFEVHLRPDTMRVNVSFIATLNQGENIDVGLSEVRVNSR